MNLVWKLLRQHISIGQFAGFFFANLFGMFIVLLGIQFYYDVQPVFTAEDSFMKADYMTVSKRIGTTNTLSGGNNSFANAEIEDIKSQSFIKDAGCFTGNEFRVSAKMGISGTSIINSEIFIQSVPDRFVDVSLDQWNYSEGDKTVPIILPRTYINMYNFGFAQSRSLPRISDGLVGLIDLRLYIHGNGGQDEFRGKVIGFSNKLNEILVPESFMKWANARYAPQNTPSANRLLVTVDNPGNPHISEYADNNGYEISSNSADAEKAAYFLRLIISLVMVIGIVISALSFYILMLSIYLLVQKNSGKLENLLLIGYSPKTVSKPYQLLTLLLNVSVLIIALVVLTVVRTLYMDVVFTLYPQIDDSTMMPSVITGLSLLFLVTLINQYVIYKKIMSIWNRQ